MAERDDVLLDLSGWPGGGTAAGPPPPRGTTLPPRPAPRRPALPVGRLGAGCAAVGLALLVLPLPGSGCVAPVRVWADSPQPRPSSAGPSLDDGQVAADTEAVRRAQLALVQPDPLPVSVPPSTVPSTRTVVRPASAQARAEVTRLEGAVAEDEEDVRDAKAARDAVVQRQQASDDPNAHDGEVAAAQEELDAAEARLWGDEAALASARRAARPSTVTVSVAPTVPAPSSAVAEPSGPSRAERTAALTAARQTQGEHLAARRAALATWTTQHATELARVDAANAHLQACEDRVRLPGGLGVLALLASAGTAWRLRTR